MGPRRFTTVVESLEARDGGTWRFVHRDAHGSEFGFHGVFHGNPSPDAIVRTFEFEGAPGHVSLETASFEDRGGRTVVHTNVVFQTVEARDAHIAAGMEGGLNESMERLDELLGTMAPVGN
jgi:uncharacterized protein YndB with AHSA1/START domain